MQTILSQTMAALIAKNGPGMAPLEGDFFGPLAIARTPCDPGRREARAHKLFRQAAIARVPEPHQ